MPCGMIVLEIVCIVSGIAGTLGMKGFGRWLYGVRGIMECKTWCMDKVAGQI